MYKEMKKIFCKFWFTNLVICCVLIFFVGTLTAKQKSEYNISYQQYAVMSMKTNSEKLEMSVDNKTISIEFKDLAIAEKAEKYTLCTPFYCVVYFIQNLSAVITDFFELNY